MTIITNLLKETCNVIVEPQNYFKLNGTMLIAGTLQLKAFFKALSWTCQKVIIAKSKVIQYHLTYVATNLNYDERANLLRPVYRYNIAIYVFVASFVSSVLAYL